MAGPEAARPDPDPAVWARIGDVVRRHDPYCAGLHVLGQAREEERLAESFARAQVEPAALDARGADLVLAHACALGDPGAVAALDQEVLAGARRVIHRYTRDDARMFFASPLTSYLTSTITSLKRTPPSDASSPMVTVRA